MNSAFSYSDLYRLAAAAWRFPSTGLAAGLADGSFAADLLACLEETGAEPEQLEKAAAALENASAADSGEGTAALFEKLRTDYTVLFLVPKKEKVYIYESLFRYPADESKKDYTMFIAPAALHAEQLYKQSGLMLRSDVREPADHFATEMEFLAQLYLRCGSEPDDPVWPERIELFKKTHTRKWYREFLTAVEGSAMTATYRALASVFLMLE